MSRLPAAERKVQLLNTAARVFATHGYTGTTTSELAKAAGVSEPIIYRHFKSKRDLFIALIERTSADTIGAWEQELKGIADPAERLVRIIRSNPMVMPRGHLRYRVIVQAMTEVEDDEIRGALITHIGRLHGFLMREVLAAQDGGQISKRFSPELTAWALIGQGLGYGMLAPLRIPKMGTDSAGNHVNDIIGLIMLGERYRQMSGAPSLKMPLDSGDAGGGGGGATEGGSAA
jgi:AcrR family transcriptional regulator